MSRNGSNRPMSASTDKLNTRSCLQLIQTDFAYCETEKRTVVVCAWQTPLTRLIYINTMSPTRHSAQTWLDYSHNNP